MLTSLCGWKFETMLQRCWYCEVSIVVTDALNEFGCGVRLECTFINNPRTIGQRVLRFNLPTFYRNAQGPAAHS